MPKYGGIHYPNDIKGTTKKGYPTHITTNSTGFGDPTKRSLDDGAVGFKARKGVLNESDSNFWKYPKSTTGKI